MCLAYSCSLCLLGVLCEVKPSSQFTYIVTLRRFVHPLLQCKSNNITHSECGFVGVVIQQPMLMLRILLSSVACLAVQYFCTLSHKQHDFREKKLLITKYVFWFSLQFFFFITFLTLGRIERVTFKNVNWSSCKVPVILLRF